MKISAGSLLFLVPYVAALNITQYEIKLPSCSLDCLSSCRPINGNISLGISCVCADLSISDNSNSCINEGCPRKESWEATRLTNELCIRQRPSRQPQLLSTVAFGALASITVNLRLYLKWKSDGRFSQDDWVMVVINFFLLIFATLGSLCVAYGFGLDAWDVGNLPLALGIFFWDELVYILILGLSKIAIITFYLRIFPYKRIRITCYVLLAWVAFNTTLFMLTALLQCVPISLNYFGWGKDGGRKRCLSLNSQAYASAAINITQDVVILLLPIPWLFRLRVSLKQKIHVIFMFSLGFFICVCSIVRICKVHKFSDDSRNPTRDFVDAIYWTAIEIYVSVIIPNLPSMRSLLARRFPTIFGLDIQNVGYRNYEPSNLPAPSCHSYEQSSRVDASHTPEDVEMGSTSASRDKTSSNHIAIEGEGDGYFNNLRMGNGRQANL